MAAALAMLTQTAPCSAAASRCRGGHASTSTSPAFAAAAAGEGASLPAMLQRMMSQCVRSRAPMAVPAPPIPGRRRLHESPRGPSHVCRVTNTSDEIYKQQGMKQVSEEDEITVNEDVVLYPELGSLEARVTKFYLDELFANTGPDLEETAYWFHTPPGEGHGS
jgi:hypothetical protein